MKKIVFTAVLFFSLLSFGQVYKIEYFDSLNTKSKNDVNFKKVTYEFQDSLFKISEYEKENLIKHYFVKDTSNWYKDTKNVSYHENGVISKIEFYKDNSRYGDSQTFYKDGKKRAVYSFEENNNSTMQILIMKQYWDVNGLQTVIDGNGSCAVDGEFFDKFTIKGSFLNGKQEGKWNSVPEKFPYIEEYYSKGKLLNGVRKISKTESKYYTEIYVQANPIGGMNEFRKLIGSNVKTKKQKTAIDGKVIIKFIVDANGKIQNPFIVKGLNDYFDNQLIEFLKISEKWNPAIYRGLNVITYYTLPVAIKVEESK